MSMIIEMLPIQSAVYKYFLTKLDQKTHFPI